MNLLQSLAAARKLGQNGFHGGGPDKRLRLLVPSQQELPDGSDEIGHAIDGTSADGLLGELSKPAFDEIEPTAAGGHKVRDKAGMFPQLGLCLVVTVGSVVVEHQVQGTSPGKDWSSRRRKRKNS